MNEFEVRDLQSFLRTVFQVYGKHLGPMIGITAILIIPFGILLLITIGHLIGIGMTFEEPRYFLFSFGIWYFIFIPIYVIVQTLLLGALTSATLQHYDKGKVNIGEAYRDAGRKFFPLLGVLILSGILVGLMFLLVVGIPFGIYFGVCWSLVYVCVIKENHNPISALSRSRELVRKAWWKVFGYLIVLSVILILISLILSIIPGIGSLISTFITLPLSVIGLTVLYIMLKGFEERKEETPKEGWDKTEGEGKEG